MTKWLRRFLATRAELDDVRRGMLNLSARMHEIADDSQAHERDTRDALAQVRAGVSALTERVEVLEGHLRRSGLVGGDLCTLAVNVLAERVAALEAKSKPAARTRKRR